MTDVCNEYGLEVGNRMANVTAKVYAPPLLEFGGGKSVNPLDRDQKGGNVNLKGQSFFKPANVGNFLIINCSPKAQNRSIDEMANTLRRVGGNFGMNFGGHKIEQEIGCVSEKSKSIGGANITVL